MVEFELKKKLRAGERSFLLECGFSFDEGSFLGIRGASGSGKTTLLRCLAGLCRPDSGTVVVGEEPWFDSNADLFIQPQHRSVGFVFQDYALFPHLTVRGNLQFATNNSERTEELLELTHMSGYALHFPRELSGGQRQRTALARALGRNPRILLLDEPLSALDEELRVSLGDELARIQRQTGVTAILVSHSRSELGRLCDQVLELEEGRIIPKP